MTSFSLGGRTFSLPEPSTFEILVWTAILSLEAAVVVTYAAVQNAQLGLFHLYPFVWLNASVLVFWKVDLPAAGRRQSLLAGVVAAAYFLVLGFFGGLYGWVPLFDHPEEHLRFFERMQGFDLALAVPPGYGPALFYTSPTLTLSISPYALVGYLALAYLVFVTVIDAVTSVVSGILGLFACVSCTWPVIASLFAGIGTSTTLMAGVYA
ncbi:DUF7546 family protein [Halopiger goleimassiliensis]|uniref:DUF7546 family protein n=1 Tax=Halopiger goleimassiliensis TaxID=1293048 RepID=UPI000677D55E|nr:hypothetical protein [Halopiger goleimassiliensis]